MTIEPCDGSPAEWEWKKSSHSTSAGAECVEVASTVSTVHVRDSKDKHGPQLSFSPAAWSDFIEFATRLH